MNFFGGSGGRRRPHPRHPLSRATRPRRVCSRGNRHSPRRQSGPFHTSADHVFFRGIQLLRIHNACTQVHRVASATTHTHNGAATRVPRYRCPSSRRSTSPVVSLMRMPFDIIFGAMRKVVSGLLGMMVFLVSWRGRRSAATELVDVAEAENEQMWQQVQALRAELLDKEQQLQSLRTVNSVYAREKIPGLLKQVKTRDELIRDYCKADQHGNMSVLVDLHNRLAKRNDMVDLLTTSQTTKRGTIQKLEARLRHRETELVQAREQLLDCSQDNDGLLEQIKEKDDLIMSLSVGEGGSSETDLLRKQIWEKTKTIESLTHGIGLPPHDEQTRLLHKQVADQEYIISSLRRRLEYSGKSGAQALEVLFFPDDRARTNLHRLVEFINGAEKSLDVCVFTITCNTLADAIVAAHQRGIAVRVISDDAQSLKQLLGDGADVIVCQNIPTQSQSKGSNIQYITAQGVHVKIDNSRYHMHHKFCIIDDKLLGNGSFNWSQQAVRYNQENLIIYDDLQLVNAFSEEFARLWSTFE